MTHVAGRGDDADMWLADAVDGDAVPAGGADTDVDVDVDEDTDGHAWMDEEWGAAGGTYTARPSRAGRAAQGNGTITSNAGHGKPHNWLVDDLGSGSDALDSVDESGIQPGRLDLSVTDAEDSFAKAAGALGMIPFDDDVVAAPYGKDGIAAGRPELDARFHPTAPENTSASTPLVGSTARGGRAPVQATTSESESGGDEPGVATVRRYGHEQDGGSPPSHDGHGHCVAESARVGSLEEGPAQEESTTSLDGGVAGRIDVAQSSPASATGRLQPRPLPDGVAEVGRVRVVSRAAVAVCGFMDGDHADAVAPGSPGTDAGVEGGAAPATAATAAASTAALHERILTQSSATLGQSQGPAADALNTTDSAGRNDAVDSSPHRPSPPRAATLLEDPAHTSPADATSPAPAVTTVRVSTAQAPAGEVAAGGDAAHCGPAGDTAALRAEIALLKAEAVRSRGVVRAQEGEIAALRAEEAKAREDAAQARAMYASAAAGTERQHEAEVAALREDLADARRDARAAQAAASAAAAAARADPELREELVHLRAQVEAAARTEQNNDALRAKVTKLKASARTAERSHRQLQGELEALQAEVLSAKRAARSAHLESEATEKLKAVRAELAQAQEREALLLVDTERRVQEAVSDLQLQLDLANAELEQVREMVARQHTALLHINDAQHAERTRVEVIIDSLREASQQRCSTADAGTQTDANAPIVSLSDSINADDDEYCAAVDYFEPGAGGVGAEAPATVLPSPLPVQRLPYAWESSSPGAAQAATPASRSSGAPSAAGDYGMSTPTVRDRTRMPLPIPRPTRQRVDNGAGTDFGYPARSSVGPPSQTPSPSHASATTTPASAFASHTSAPHHPPRPARRGDASTPAARGGVLSDEALLANLRRSVGRV